MSSQFFGMLSHGLQGYFKTYTPIIRVFGQSNARGRGVVLELEPRLQGAQDNIEIWNNSTYEKYNAAVNGLGDEFSVEIWNADKLQSQFNEVVKIIKYGVGGTTLGINPGDPLDECWLPTGYLLYDNLITTSAAAMSFAFDKPPIILADIWIQGESDAADGSDYYDVYEANQRTLITQLRADTDAIYLNEGYTDELADFLSTYGLEKIPFIDIQLSNNTVYPAAGKTAVRAAKTAILNDASVKDTFLVDTTQAVFIDGQHYDMDSLENVLASQITTILNNIYLK